MIRWLLLLLIALAWVADVLSLDTSLAPGLSLKNAVLYALAASLIFRKVMGAESKVRLPTITAYFAILVGYALASTVFAGPIAHYSGYHLTNAVIELKSELADSAVFCLVVFYGLRDEDIDFFLKALLGAVALANILTLGSLAGIVPLAVRIGDEGAEYGRVFGFFGHANETGELISCLLPAMIAFCFTGRGLSRAIWTVGTLGSAIVFILTVSRGAYVATAVSVLWGAYLCRRYVNLSRLFGWVLIALVVLAVGVALACLIDPDIRGVLVERLLGQSLSVDTGEMSSGRTDIWTAALLTMAQKPITFVTGYGWYVYQSMPFLYGTHNYYLDMWFDLGLVGVGMFVLIMRRTVVMGLQAMQWATEQERRFLFAFVCGALAFAVADFFAVIFAPLPYIWMYFGAMLRVAATIQVDHTRAPARAAGPPLGVAVRLNGRGGQVPASVR